MSSSISAEKPTLRRRSAKEISEGFALGRKAKKLLTDPQPPADYLKLLIERQCYPDAIRFMAYSITARQSIWWACLVARHVVDVGNANDMAALQAALHWVVTPTEERRQATKAAAERAMPNSPAAYVAKAAANAAVESKDFRGPGDQRAARFAAAAILASVARSPEKPIRLRFRQFVAIGLDVAVGVLKWDAAAR